FNNAVDGEELGMNTKILDAQGNRMVCDGNSDPSNGKYILYVPKSGEYRYKVRTAMSPEVFDVVIDVPQFNKPVAIRQEMTLKNESGKFILDVQTFFEQPLDEDLSLLAAEMLRKKSKLDVDGQAEVTEMTSDLDTPGQDMSTYAKDMDHVAINAGFNEGTTVASVITEINDELKTTSQAISASQQLQLVAMTHASKCQKEADALMKEAEEIRSRIKTVKTSQDADDLRKSVQLVDAAEEKMREAKSALMVNKSESGNQTELSQTKKEQEQRIAALTAASEKDDYEATLTLLKSEKDYRNEQSEHRDSRKDSIRVALNNSEKILSQKENQLVQMRADLTDLEKQKDELTNKISITEKSKEKEALREEFIQVSSSADAKRAQLKKFEGEIIRQRDDVGMLTAQLKLEESLEKNADLGITKSELTALSPTEQRLLEMRVDEILTRKDAIAITDTALLSYIENETLAPSASGTSQKETTSPLLVAESKAEFVREMTGDIAAPFSTSVALFSMEEEYQRISDKIALGTATSEEQLQISELSKGIQEKRVQMNAADAKL
ncbi:MAG: hypothetical protein ACKOZY_04705, partial [Flavobacteriales bacterium]